MEKSLGFYLLLAIMMLVFGAGNTFMFQLQDYGYALGQEFKHPFMQAFTMFIEMNKLEAEEKGLETKYNPWLYLIPAACDFCGTSLQFFGLIMLSPSIYQIMKGGVVVVTAIASKIFLKKRLFSHHWTGIALVVLGIGMTGISALQNTSNDSNSNPVLGIILILSSLIAQGAQFTIEEKIFQTIYIEPLKVTASEGFWGMCISIVMIPIFNFIPLPSNLNGGICGPVACSEGGTKYLERTDVYFKQIGASGCYLWLSIIGGMFTIAFFNASGVAVTKYLSSIVRSILDVSRVVIVWGVSLFLPLPSRLGKGHWETFDVLELFGFFVLVLGNFIYNEIIIVRLCSMDSNTQYLKQFKNKGSAKQSLIANIEDHLIEDENETYNTNIN